MTSRLLYEAKFQILVNFFSTMLQLRESSYGKVLRDEMAEAGWRKSITLPWIQELQSIRDSHIIP
jgi:hypothetical protein